ncbi:MAG: Elastase inhibitor AFLEI Flags: Precursor [Proteobacteria bacterium]|nr:Elastase inhibitor AFLEI Flags: Precursor [Pseudomonadota bacterium]
MTLSILRRPQAAPALLAMSLVLALAACSQQKPSEAATDPVAAAPAASPEATVPADATVAAPADGVPAADAPVTSGQCNADAVQGLVGQTGSEDVLEKARTDSGANTVRALKPGEPATMDFRQDRLDIALDEQGVIQSLRCG